MDASPGLVVVGWISLHVAALAAACCTRVSAGPRLSFLAQVCFFTAMLVIALVAWSCQQHQAGSWGFSAFTLVGMVITAVFDFGRLNEPAHSRQWPLTASESN
jgi:hypothetical protein